MTSIVYPDTTVSFTYDAGANGVGHLTGASDANHSLAFGYDARGHVTGKTQIVGGTTRSVGYTYTDGNLTAIVTPSSQLITYGYTSGRVSSIAINGVPLLSGVLYEPFGPIRQWTWGDSTVSVRTFDEDGKVTQIDTGGEFYSYGYDDAFRIQNITNSSSAALSWTSAYDNLDRLTSATSPARNESWTYDPNGNRLTQSGTTPSVFSNTVAVSTTSNRLSSISGSCSNTYGYDNAGNVTSETAAARAVQISATTTTTYRYNAFGQRIAKTVGTLATHFVYEEAGHLLTRPAPPLRAPSTAASADQCRPVPPQSKLPRTATASKTKPDTGTTPAAEI